MLFYVVLMTIVILLILRTSQISKHMHRLEENMQRNFITKFQFKNTLYSEDEH
jgi:hypothetical protein